MSVIHNEGIPSNGPATLQIGNARLTADELTALLIRAGHPDPHVARTWLMNGTSRQTIVRRTAQDSLNEMEAKELRFKAEVLERALRRRLSSVQCQVLDLAAEHWIGSSTMAEKLGVSLQQASNVITKLADLGLLERNEMGHPDRRVRLYRSVLAPRTMSELALKAHRLEDEPGDAIEDPDEIADLLESE